MQWPDEADPDADDGGSAPQIPFPRRSDGKIVSCSSADTGRAHTGFAGPVTSFLLPVSADALSVFGRGALSHGGIEFLPTADPSIPEGNIRVDVTPRAETSIALESANICLLAPKANERSIAILVSFLIFRALEG